MTILFVLIVVSALVSGLFLAAFIWSVKTGQFDDSYTPSVRMLFDDMPTEKPKTTNQSEKSKSNNTKSITNSND